MSSDAVSCGSPWHRRTIYSNTVPCPCRGRRGTSIDKDRRACGDIQPASQAPVANARSVPTAQHILCRHRRPNLRPPILASLQSIYYIGTRVFIVICEYQQFFFGVFFLFKLEPTLKSKACFKCLYFTKIISDLCRCLEYFFVSFLFYHDRVAHARTMCGVVYSHAHHRVGTAIIKKPFGVMIH